MRQCFCIDLFVSRGTANAKPVGSSRSVCCVAEPARRSCGCLDTESTNARKTDSVCCGKFCLDGLLVWLKQTVYGRDRLGIAG